MPKGAFRQKMRSQTVEHKLLGAEGRVDQVPSQGHDAGKPRPDRLDLTRRADTQDGCDLWLEPHVSLEGLPCWLDCWF